ncbi:jg233 [Pararge aegeria aegeria]|uniref:Jg233 protein n=1 Tax=Pararge aegeria aegeria TaxID=348720 RepID=A0A8S4QDL8_9NEOP|nr:jg233 [Pararge aegeria aegeria]
MGWAHCSEKVWTQRPSTVPRCWNGSPALVSPALVDPPRGGQTTLSASQVAAGSKRHKTVEFGTSCKTPIEFEDFPGAGGFKNEVPSSIPGMANSEIYNFRIFSGLVWGETSAVASYQPTNKDVPLAFRYVVAHKPIRGTGLI